MKLLKFIAITWITFNSILIQAQIPNGSWRDHLPFKHAKAIAEVGNKIFCSTTGGLFSFNKADNSLQKYSKVNGLSDVSISTICYSETASTLVVGYENGNIDLIRNDSVINLPDIKLKLIIGDKNIYSIQFINNYAYLSCGFGIVVVDLFKKEIKDTYQFGNQGGQIKVNNITFDGQYIFAATNQGIYKADINSTNLVDYNNWEKLVNLPVPNSEYTSVVYFGGKLLSSYRNPSLNVDEIIEITSISWKVWDRSYPDYFRKFFVHNNLFHVTSLYISRVYDQSFNEKNYAISLFANFVLYDKSEIFWIADPDSGLLKFESNVKVDQIAPNGPEYLDVGEIVYSGGNIWVAGGNEVSKWSGYGAYLFKNEQWQNLNKNTIPEMEPFLNIHQIAVDPVNPNHIFGGSIGYGVAELSIDNQFTIYDEEDGILKPIEGFGHGYIRVKGMSYDKKGNLWMVCNEVANPVYVIRPDGRWENIKLSYSDFDINTRISDIYANSYGDIWLLIERSGILCFHENENDGSFDEKFFTVKNQEDVLFNRVISIAEDLEGDIWIGTDIGPMVYYKPSNIFNETSIKGYQILIPRNDGTNNADLLLNNERINCITVDGANRKWFGTEKSGAFLMSVDGKEQNYSFNTSNSPLFSDNVVSIAINNDNGEVFFGTDKGILSYKGQATAGGDDFKDVYVFPNPVRENFFGDITIKGLVRDANVKITDISGNLVNETTALGGQAIWDGKNFNGERVHTGVYLIFCSNEDGTKTYVTKLLFIH